MATVDDASAEHRGLAERMPADIRERLDPAELRLRLAEVARLQNEIGSMPDHVTARGTSEHAEAMLKALPYTELEEQCRNLRTSATQATTTLEASGCVQASIELRRTNPQAQAMTRAAELADLQDGASHLTASRVPEHRRLANAAQVIRVQRAQIMQGKRPGAVTPSTPTKRAGRVRERHEPADVTKASDVEVVPMLNKAAGAASDGSGRLVTKSALRAEVTKAVTAAYAEAGLDERLTRLAADIRTTRAEIAGRTSTMGAPITNMRSH